MPVVTYWGGKENGTYRINRTDLNHLALIKTRGKNKCHNCEAEIAPGSFCLGSGYTKTCLKCAEGFIKNFINSMEDYSKQAQELLVKLQKGQADMTKNNILARVRT